MGYRVTIPPTVEPIPLAEAKEHLRIETTEDDALLQSIIAAARIAIENYLDQKLITQTVVEYFESFPENGSFDLRFYPVQSIDSITYVDTDGATQTWDSSNYQVDLYGLYGGGPARIDAAYSATYPSIREQMSPVTVTYVAGYGGRDDVPEDIKAAMRLLIADLYDNRNNPTRERHTLWMNVLNVSGYKKII
jgi:uncharacterized phiE125 gp8 family phage protein